MSGISPDQSLAESRGSSRSYRMATRLLAVSQVRPPAPREFLAATGNRLEWVQPENTDFVTHYRIRIDRDEGDPHYQVPVGTTACEVLAGSTFYLTSFNEVSRLESDPVVLAFTPSTTAIFNTSEITLTADTALTYAGTPSGMLAVFLIQDGTGGWQITWDVAKFEKADVNIDTRPNKMTALLFFVRPSTGLYCQMSLETGL